MRFAVRRPATSPGHRPSEGGSLVMRDGRTAVAPVADRSRHGGLGAPAPARRALARYLLAPPDDATGSAGETGPAGPWETVEACGPKRAWAESPAVRDTAEAYGPGRDLAGPPMVSAWEWPDGAASGCGSRVLATGWGSAGSSVVSSSERSDGAAAYDSRTLCPTRVLAGPPVSYAEQRVPELGATTAGLLTRHLAEGRAAGARQVSAPPAVPEIPRRERRPLPGRQAGALTPRVR